MPDVVNPEAWLSWVDGEYVVRQVHRQGFVKVDLRTYYVSSKLAGHAVTLRIEASEACFHVVHPQANGRSLPLKGLQQRSMTYQDSVLLMQKEASTQQRLLALQKRRHRSFGSSSP